MKFNQRLDHDVNKSFFDVYYFNQSEQIKKLPKMGLLFKLYFLMKSFRSNFIRDSESLNFFSTFTNEVCLNPIISILCCPVSLPGLIGSYSASMSPE